MRAGDPGFEITPDGADFSWKIGRSPGQAWPKKGWGTDFSCFRMAIPPMHNFNGRAIYLDADMLVRGDIAELLEIPLERPIVCLDDRRTDVAVIDCAAVGGEKGHWPLIQFIKSSGYRMFEWMRYLHKHKYISTKLPSGWNCCDPHRPLPDPGLNDSMKLLHFTTVPTQPWAPYDSVRYVPHPYPSWVAEWHKYHAEAVGS